MDLDTAQYIQTIGYQGEKQKLYADPLKQWLHLKILAQLYSRWIAL
jgi:hypothetical protein